MFIPDGPAVTEVYTVRPDILAIRVDAGRVIRQKQVPYVPRIGDSIEEDILERDGRELGLVVGKNRDVFTPFDEVAGKDLDTRWSDSSDSYRIFPAGDPNGIGGIVPEEIYRKSKPTDIAWVGDSPRFEFPATTHTLFLDLPEDLVPGQTYTIDFQGQELKDVTFDYRPKANRSEAIHVSQIGFRPDDPAKIAFLSMWMGKGGGLDYAEGLPFWLIDERTERTVYAGTTELSQASDVPEDPLEINYNSTDVYQMDFSDVRRPGRYRLCVSGIGCSLGFEIGQTVWKDAFYVSARGFFHQRNGIALGPPYTDYVRPRPFLPDDGVKVYQSNVALMDVDMGLGEKSAFEALVENRTDEIVPNAWGGYFDAGDWDRRAQHLEATRALLELAELFPEYFSTVDLNIPESQNALPDIVDEALWNLDFFKRLQTPEGGVRGGIETSEHPELGETSWENSLDVFAYAPDIWSSYLYAGVAARAAHWLVLKDPDLAMAYRNSAVKAMQWAEQEWHRSQHRDLPIEVNDERNLAALELYRLTGDRHWHQLFLSTTAFTDPNAPVFLWEHHEQRNAAFLYARLQDLAVNSTVQANAARALQREADDLAAFSAGTGFKWSKADPYTQLGWGDGLGVPQTESLIRAHVLTGKRRYLRAAILAAQFSAGANPDNMTFTSGVGLRSPKHPFVIDARLTHQAIPGITVYGSANLDKLRDKDWFLVHHLRHSQVSPNPWNWPITEGYFDTYWFIMQNEFTVHEAIAPTAYTWGYLAARAALRE